MNLRGEVSLLGGKRDEATEEAREGGCEEGSGIPV
jgi:hypothetical protein